MAYRHYCVDQAWLQPGRETGRDRCLPDMGFDASSLIRMRQMTPDPRDPWRFSCSYSFTQFFGLDCFDLSE